MRDIFTLGALIAIASAIATVLWKLISLISIEIPAKDVPELVRRGLDAIRRREMDILIIGPSEAGKTWFVTSLRNTTTQEDLDRIGMTLGVDRKYFPYSRSEDGREIIQFQSMDIGGFEIEWIRVGLSENLQPVALLLFFHHEEDRQEETVAYIRQVTDILSSNQYADFRKRLRVVVPIVSKSDVWLTTGEPSSRREALAAIQTRYRAEYNRVQRLFGSRVCHSEFLPCSAQTSYGVRDILKVISDRIT